MNREISAFVERYVKEIRNNNAAIFAGAGFSKSSGYVDWKNLLRDIAEELGLNVDKEHDLVSLAQYCYNKNGNRSIINDVIFEEFSKEKEFGVNHKILARLPIFTYWTTNYDSLIEDALADAQRVVDVKYNNKQFSITKPHRDAVVYKMHGDKNNPDEAILIKDDYEKYYCEHTQFITALSGDLISKTFLFIGFSFADPNIDYILSRIRIDYGENKRQHYALIRKIKENEDTRQKLWKQYREDMISRAGISIFLFGNKLENGNIVLANGMRSEYQIAKEQHNLIVPIGCTGYVAQEIWEEVNKNLAKYYNKVEADLKEIFEKLNSKVDNNTLIDNVLKFIKLIRR